MSKLWVAIKIIAAFIVFVVVSAIVYDRKHTRHHRRREE